MRKKNTNYWGIFYNRDAVVITARIARYFSWIIAIFYSLQWFLQVAVFITQVTRGFWTGMGFTDITQNLFWLVEQPLKALVYFAVLQGVSQVLLMIMDIENNTRSGKISSLKT